MYACETFAKLHGRAFKLSFHEFTNRRCFLNDSMFRRHIFAAEDNRECNFKRLTFYKKFFNIED